MQVDRLDDPEREGLFPLLDEYLEEIGEPPLDGPGRARVAAAAAEGRILFVGARRDGSLAGICSLAMAWSTFGGGAPMGILEDVYVAPAHRRRGVARALAERVFEEARAAGCSSVTVGCGEGDVGLDRSLGFDLRLGALLSRVLAPEG